MPRRADVIQALRRMVSAADHRGQYVVDGMDARWLEAAIEMLTTEAEARDHQQNANATKG